MTTFAEKLAELVERYPSKRAAAIAAEITDNVQAAEVTLHQWLSGSRIPHRDRQAAILDRLRASAPRRRK